MTIILPDAPSTPDGVGTATHRVRVRRRACPPWCVVQGSGEDHRHGRPEPVWVPGERVTLTAAPLWLPRRHVELVATSAAGRSAVVAEWRADQVDAITWALSYARGMCEYPRAASSWWCDVHDVGHDTCIRWYPVLLPGPVLYDRVPVVRLEAPRRRYARQRVAFGPAGPSTLYRLTVDQVGDLMTALTTAAGTPAGRSVVVIR